MERKGSGMLTRNDHKRIALNVAEEIRNVLADHNGARLAAKIKAKKAAAPPPDVAGDDEDMEAALGAPEPQDEEMAEEMPMHASVPPKPTKKGFPFSKGGGGMRGRGLKHHG